MTTPLPCPLCRAPTDRAYRPNLLEPGDVEPYEWCTTCGWDTDSVTAAICPHSTTDHCPKCGANKKETNDYQN